MDTPTAFPVGHIASQPFPLDDILQLLIVGFFIRIQKYSIGIHDTAKTVKSIHFRQSQKLRVPTGEFLAFLILHKAFVKPCFVKIYHFLSHFLSLKIFYTFQHIFLDLVILGYIFIGCCNSLSGFHINQVFNWYIQSLSDFTYCCGLAVVPG